MRNVEVVVEGLIAHTQWSVRQQVKNFQLKALYDVYVEIASVIIEFATVRPDRTDDTFVHKYFVFDGVW